MLYLGIVILFCLSVVLRNMLEAPIWEDEE